MNPWIWRPKHCAVILELWKVVTMAIILSSILTGCLLTQISQMVVASHYTNVCHLQTADKFGNPTWLLNANAGMVYGLWYVSKLTGEVIISCRKSQLTSSKFGQTGPMIKFFCQTVLLLFQCGGPKMAARTRSFFSQTFVSTLQSLYNCFQRLSSIPQAK